MSSLCFYNLSKPLTMSRTELGYCGIEYRETSGTTIDAFAIFSTITNTQIALSALAESTDGNDCIHIT